MTEPVLVAWSGGKDSALALQEILGAGRYRVAALLTTVTGEYDRISMHGVRRTLLRRQAESLGLPQSFAGREFDAALLNDLPPGVDPCGENGEFHTFVYAGPILRAPVPHRRGAIVVREGRFVYCDLEEIPTS